MPDLRAAPALPPELAEPLSRPAYKQDFRHREAEIRNAASWKLERRQHFEEQGSASREALRRGDWHEALRLLDARRDVLRATAEDDERRGHVFHRVRVVETPLTPYLRWELHSLRLRAEYGERIRVLGAAAVAAAESAGPLPELTILGGHTLYRVRYTDTGVPDGALRHTDPELVARWVAYLGDLYNAGEDVTRYVDREVAHLPPPTTRAE